MDFDLVLRDVRLADAKADQPATDIGVKDGRIAVIAPRLGGSAQEQVQGGGRLVCSGFVETHIHLDKSRIIDRCAPQERSQLSPVKGVTPLKSAAGQSCDVEHGANPDLLAVEIGGFGPGKQARHLLP